MGCIYLGDSGIADKLTTNINDYVAQSYTPNVVSGGPTVNVLHDDGGMVRTSTLPGTLATVTVNPGEVARFTYETYAWGNEQALEVTDGTTSYLLSGFGWYTICIHYRLHLNHTKRPFGSRYMGLHYY